MSVRRRENVEGGTILLFYYYHIMLANQIKAHCLWDFLPRRNQSA